MPDQVRSDAEDRLRVLLMMPHTHAHGMMDYTDEDLQRCTGCQQDQAGWINAGHFLDKDGKLKPLSEL